MSSPTAALLWAACRPEVAIDEITAAVDAGADLDAAAEIALVERVSPLLWRALRAAGVATDGHDWATVLQQDAARCHAQSRLVLPRIGELAFAPLADAGLEALVIKGAALVGRYPDEGLRPMDDVDLILPAHQCDAAVTALQAVGWRALPSPPRRGHEIDLTHPELPGLHLDLHRGLSTWRTRANRLTGEQLWETRRPTKLFGAPAFVLPPEPELVMLAAHAAKPFHTFDRMVWTADIAMVVAAAEAAGGVNWTKVTSLADAARCRTAVAVALCQATRLGVNSPPELRHLDERSGRIRALRAVLSADWPMEKRDREIRARVRFALVDEWRARYTLVVSEIFSKSVREAPRRAGVAAKRGTRHSWQRFRERPGRSESSSEKVGDGVEP